MSSSEFKVAGGVLPAAFPSRGAPGRGTPEGRGRGSGTLRQSVGSRFVLAAGLVLLAAAGASAQDRGVYVRVDVNGAALRELSVATSGVNHPTRCDSLLYANPSDAPRDAECTANTAQEFFSNLFDPGYGLGAGAAVGYRFGRLRLEFSVLASGGWEDEALIALGSTTDTALQSKSSEWSTDDPPSESLAEVRVRQGFANAIVDLSNASPITPYLGAGVGVGQVRAEYAVRMLRRNDLGPAEWQRAASGTWSTLDADLSSNRVGVQAFAGLALDLGGRTALDVRGHWVRFGGFTSAGQLWTQIRDHEPVRADGTTPFTTDIALGDLDRLGFTLGLRYRF